MTPIPGHGRPNAVARTAALALLALGSGCGDDAEVTTKPIVHPVPAVSIATLQSAPEELKFGGITFLVEVSLWRDYLPPTPPEGRPLAASVSVTADGVVDWPSEVTSAYLWVLKDASVWATWLKPAGPPAGEPLTRIYGADGGPLWGPGIAVDAVVGLRTSDGALHLVRLTDVTIIRTE